MSLATVGGSAVTRALVQVPAWGLIWADVDLVEPVALTGRQTLTIADVSLSMAIVSGGVHDGKASYRLVSGAGGWGRDVPAKGHADDLGVKVSTIAGDLTAACGEAITGAPSTRRGSHYARAQGPAFATLCELAPRAWYSDFAGVVHFGARPTVAYTGDGVRTRVDPASRVIELATESIATLVPGVTIDGSLPATDIEYELDAAKLTVRVYSGRASTRRLEALRKIVAALDPGTRYRGVFEFRVVSQSGERFNLQPVRAASGMSELLRVPIRPPFGVRATAVPGAQVLVAFADADPSRPQIIAGDAPGSPGWMPLELDFGETPRLGVARVTDAIQAGPFAGVITSASGRIKAGI